MKEKLRHYRQRMGYTQKEIARMAGISQPYYNQIETGARKASFDLIVKIGKYLGYTVELRDRTADDVNKEFGM